MASGGGNTCEIMGSGYLCPFRRMIAVEWQRFWDRRESVQVLSVLFFLVLFPGRSSGQGKWIGFEDLHSSVCAVPSLGTDLSRELAGPSGFHSKMPSVIYLYHYPK